MRRAHNLIGALLILSGIFLFVGWWVDFDMRGELKFFIGVAIGVAIGVGTGNLGLGIGIGIALGAALSQVKNEQKSTNSDSREDEEYPPVPSYP